jgi:hypothetical protein
MPTRRTLMTLIREQSPPSQAAAWSRSSTRLEEQGILMAKSQEPWSHLATRIPKALHHRVKMYCVTHDAMLMQFVVEAIEAKLRRVAGKRRT